MVLYSIFIHLYNCNKSRIKYLRYYIYEYSTK